MDSRRLTPEILDYLPHEDPEALRARRDLFRLNRIMGNYRWIASRIVAADHVAEWVEIGSGDGHLADAIPAEVRGSLRVTGVDFLPRPVEWPVEWHWQQEDLFSFLENYGNGNGSRTGLIANLFLHHFDGQELRRIGSLVERHFSHFLLNEPCRRGLHLFQSRLAYPFIGTVTRHDMPVSIEAGFRKGELHGALGIEIGGQWNFSEAETFLGAYRLESVRRRR